MATVVAAPAPNATTAAGTTGAAPSYTPAVGELLLGFGHASGSVGSFSASDIRTGGTYTRVADAVKATSVDTLWAFVRDNLTSQTLTHQIIADFAGDSSTGSINACVAVSGMTNAGAAAVRQVATSSNNAASTPSATFPAACLTGNVVIAYMGCAQATATTPPTGFTEAWDPVTANYTVPTQGGSLVYRDNGFTGSTITWGSAVAGGQWAMVAVELDVPAPSAAPYPFRRHPARGLVVR